ncbi:MAG TPA: putative toxin-antitoxin system toxin component, PIN family [Candidatus Borkfalkia faecavium]|uniref:Toxin-antitoxin system toxin component, PIN family n=1 Tax=Candidatus Borkfalkia faecavium TaxID=2838508 RepID=A0A9D1VZT1_9FIRM|nr:putative toxin-antitoxin system toxin component, PIN family [Candidatus Borkfalkia faecavium]
MRVLIDTNILISALLFPSSVPARALLRAVSEDELVLCDQNIAELREVLRRKAPARLPAAEALLAELSYELIPAVVNTQKTIRDEKDQPILNAAVLYEVDAVVTGDKDFLSLGLARPRCLTAAQYLRKEW